MKPRTFSERLLRIWRIVAPRQLRRITFLLNFLTLLLMKSACKKSCRNRMSLTSSKRSCGVTCSPGEAAVALGTVASGVAGAAGTVRGRHLLWSCPTSECSVSSTAAGLKAWLISVCGDWLVVGLLCEVFAVEQVIAVLLPEDRLIPAQHVVGSPNQHLWRSK